ncbi:MYXO-CTERM sorting domain-containing protein [Pajaroellobacter abortibovis]|uniref:PE-PGRS family protein n=1 Tax=Pajaroellobacter abortibovis TaxID=1882918 RepID=A0A1L6MW88_9BACT|nr:MYXO-CTERM sorting domain-containing protein [Pajaroellobacter abortibovis]APR99792.1 hypothetical protein BCY86_03205 [Pajaroellobacter abortibovis]
MTDVVFKGRSVSRFVSKYVGMLGVVASLALVQTAQGADTYGLGTGKDGDKAISGVAETVLHRYAQVTAIIDNKALTVTERADNDAIAPDAPKFEPGVMVLLIQSTGYGKDFAQLPVPRKNSVDPWLKSPLSMTGTSVGKFELARIKTASNGTIGLTKPLEQTFDPIVTQVLTVGEYQNMMIDTGTRLVPLPWNGATGGVVAVFAAQKLTNNGSISADGAGFRGGAPSANPIYQGARTAKNCNEMYGAPHKGRFGYRGESFELSAFTVENANKEKDDKSHSPVASQVWAHGGYGVLLSGGAGGGCRGSGGGGGGNGAAGGRGGNAHDLNKANMRAVGGMGGAKVDGDFPASLFMGGGGGGGHQSHNLGSAGGSGGGIVIVRAGEIDGNGAISSKGVTANANNPSSGNNNDGKGGGGAGGSVLIQVAGNYAAGGTVSVNGGSGGAVATVEPDKYGSGGGGGAGNLCISAAALPNTIEAKGGQAGNPGIRNAQPGGNVDPANNAACSGAFDGAPCTGDDRKSGKCGGCENDNQCKKWLGGDDTATCNANAQCEGQGYKPPPADADAGASGEDGRKDKKDAGDAGDGGDTGEGGSSESGCGCSSSGTGSGPVAGLMALIGIVGSFVARRRQRNGTSA